MLLLVEYARTAAALRFCSPSSANCCRRSLGVGLLSCGLLVLPKRWVSSSVPAWSKTVAMCAGLHEAAPLNTKSSEMIAAQSHGKPTQQSTAKFGRQWLGGARGSVYRECLT